MTETDIDAPVRGEGAGWTPAALEFLWNPPAVPGLTPRGEVAAACRFLYSIGYDEHLFGHVTWKQSDGSYLTNCYEATWDQIRASDIVAVDLDGRKVEEHPRNPSAGLNLHASVRHFVPDGRHECVIHAHSRYGILWAVRAEVPPIYDQGSAWIGDEVHVAHDPTALWFDEADAVALDRCGWALMERHGVITSRPTLHEAIYRLAILEHRSRQAWLLEGRNATPMAPDIAATFPSVIPPVYTSLWWNAALRQQVGRDPSVLQ